MASAKILPIGKLPVPLLRRELARCAASNPISGSRRLVVGPGIGLDAAAIRWGSEYLIAKTDPITFVSKEAGEYALTINANDLATMGAVPRWFLATLLMPAGATTAGSVSQLFAQLRAACRALKVSLCGGHTEVTDAVTRPVIVGSLLGECPKNRLLSTRGARVGDAIYLTKGIPIEAVSILARNDWLDVRRRYSRRFLARCRRYLIDPGISILHEARLAMATEGVHAMHDPTEGGLSAALYELAEAAKVGVMVDESHIRVLPEGARLCADFGLHPLGSIASGALLICLDPKRGPILERRLRRSGISAARIGTVVPARAGVRMVTRDGSLRNVPRFAVDEVARILGKESGKHAAKRGGRSVGG